MGNYNSSGISTKTIKEFDPTRYVGEWFEVGRYPTLIYERGCAGAKAIYRWDPSLEIMSIENVCLDPQDKPLRRSFGRARVANKSDPGKLLVEFNDALPFDMGEQPYWIHYTDYDNYALVGGPDGNFLWLLARKSKVPKEEVTQFINIIKNLGYDPDKLLLNVGRVY